jgi:hypothetical protein
LAGEGGQKTWPRTRLIADTVPLLAADCALAGGYSGGAFAKGWAHILSCLSFAAEAPERPGGRLPAVPGTGIP